MKLSLSFVLRLGGADTLEPVENARVKKNGETAAHRDGGYYVFFSPMREGERISAEAPGYSPSELCWDGGKSGTMYLHRDGLQLREVTLLSAGKYDRGAEEIAVVCSGGVLPIMLEGCALRYGGSGSNVTGWDRVSGIMRITPAAEDISQGQPILAAPAGDEKARD